MTDSDAFSYGEDLGLARAVLYAKRCAAIYQEQGHADAAFVAEGLARALEMTPGTREALAWLKTKEGE